MRKLIVIFLATLFLLLSAPTYNAEASPQTDNSINSIRQQYLAINQRTARHKKVKKELSGFSLEGGELIAYFDGPAIVKIVATHYGEMGRSVDEYYYSTGKLIFVFERVSHYNKPMSGKVVRTVEDRYYLSDDNLIRWVDENGKLRDTANRAAQSKLKEILADSNLLTAGVRSRNPTIEK
jgi:hypothetical protein